MTEKSEIEMEDRIIKAKMILDMPSAIFVEGAEGKADMALRTLNGFYDGAL